MRLSAEQMAMLSADQTRRYCVEVAEFLRQQFPQLVHRVDGPQLSYLVGLAVERADWFGIATDECRLKFVALTIVAGPKFVTEPRVASFLVSDGGTPDAKTSWLFEHFARRCADAM